jgi:hypothetical protein
MKEIRPSGRSESIYQRGFFLCDIVYPATVIQPSQISAMGREFRRFPQNLTGENGIPPLQG